MNVQKALESKNLSLDSVSKMLGIHRNSLYNKLNGKSCFTIEEAYLIKKEVLPEFDWDYLFAPDKQSSNDESKKPAS